MHYLHGLKQLHVVLIPSSSFHLMIQLQNDFIFKLIKKEKSKHWAASQRSTHFNMASKMYLCIIMSHIPKGEMLGHILVWALGMAESLDTDFHKASPALGMWDTSSESVAATDSFVLMQTTAPCSEGRKEPPQGSWQVINTSGGTGRALVETYTEIKFRCFT